VKNKISKISFIQTGLFAKTVVQGETCYLQARDLNEDGKINSSISPSLLSKEISEKHLLKKGDVLFIAKGPRNVATVYKELKYPAVASTSFFVLRLFDKNILSEYLAWFLNHPKTQQILKENAAGSSMISISKSVLEELEIPVPDIETQKAILKIMQLRDKEKELKQRIEGLREKIVQEQIFNVLMW
jgi:restriction endonuclease S subunit